MTPFDTIKIEDMPNEDLRWIAEDCGLQTASALLLHFGKGINLYIPKFEPENWEKVKIENLPNDDMRLVAEKCGLSTTRKLLEKFPQMIVYIPRLETTQWARNYAKQNYDGSNAKRLAAALGVSERYIYKCQHSVSNNEKAMSKKDGIIDGYKQEKLDLGIA
jgi:hypothetical protein